MASNSISLGADTIFIVHQRNQTETMGYFSDLETTTSYSNSDLYHENYISFMMESTEDHGPNDFKTIELYIFKNLKDCDLSLNSAPDLHFELDGNEDIDEGIQGRVLLYATWPDGKQNEYFLKEEKRKNNLYNKICINMGYRKAEIISKGEKEKINFYNLEKNDKQCPQLLTSHLNKAPNYEKMYLRNFKYGEEETFCYKNYKKGEKVLNLKCTGEITRSSSLAQQSWGHGKCLKGYTARDGLCAPNICHCQNGTPRTSDYDHVAQICGYTAAVKNVPVMQKNFTDIYQVIESDLEALHVTQGLSPLEGGENEEPLEFLEEGTTNSNQTRYRRSARRGLKVDHFKIGVNRFLGLSFRNFPGLVEVKKLFHSYFEMA